MSHYKILIVDLDPHYSPIEVCNCKQLPRLIQSFLPLGEMHLQTVTTFPPTPMISPPDLILFRPSAKKLSLATLYSFREAWSETSILGLFCVKWENPHVVSQALLNGLDDFVSCPFTEVDLFPRLQRLLQVKTVADPSSHAKRATVPFQLKPLVGESKTFLGITELIPLLARSDATILITGETGTGKELVARAIHYYSPRQNKPFIPVNCGALPDHLLENELFGHAKGAFTDASSAEKGLIAEAEGGSLFLDEIDALSLPSQVKLLRFLQDWEYRPLGSSKSKTANVRVIAATNADLWQQVHDKSFREDFYHRLHVLSLAVPSLRERAEDIPLLANHFLLRYGQQYHREPLRFSSGALQKLLAYHWPGNIRELEGVVQRAVILAPSATLQPNDITISLERRTVEHHSFRVAKASAVKQFERAYLMQLLVEHQGNISRAAQAAGKERRAFHRLLQKYGLKRHVFISSSQ